MGLFWPYPNHTFAVWMPRLAAGPPIRIVIPTPQILLTDRDTFDTRKFDPWRQKTIYRREGGLDEGSNKCQVCAGSKMSGIDPAVQAYAAL